MLDLAQEVADAVDGKRKHPHHAKEVADHAPGKDDSVEWAGLQAAWREPGTQLRCWPCPSRIVEQGRAADLPWRL